MAAPFDELYRFTVVRKPPADLSGKAVLLPKASPDALQVGSDDNIWAIDRVPNQAFLNELIQDHSSRPPAKPELRDMARKLDAPTDESSWHLLAAHIVGTREFGQTRAGVAELVTRALAHRPEADSALVYLVHAVVMLDTLVVLSREESEDGPSEERWQKLANRPLLRPDLDAAALTSNNADTTDTDSGHHSMSNFGRSGRQVSPVGSQVFSFFVPGSDGSSRRPGIFAAPGRPGIGTVPPPGELPDFGGVLLDQADRMPSKIQPIGRQDLLVVRTRQLGYRLADISHIENVSAAEKKIRVHEMEMEEESTFETENEVETSVLSDLTTTSRDEVREQIKAQQERSISLEGRIRATYRGPVEVEAEASASMSQRRARSTDIVKTHSVEVVERAVESVRERTSERLSRKVRMLMREANTHEFDSGTDKALMYQWVKRVDRAAVYNYGEREMYDFVIPKPSNNLRVLSQAAPPQVSVRRPPPDNLFEELMDAISGNDGLAAIDQFLENGALTAAFEIGEPPPRPEGEWVSIEANHQGEKGDASDNWHAAAQDIVVPGGTRGTRLRISFHTFAEGRASGDSGVLPRISVVVGDVHLWARMDTIDRDLVKNEHQGQLANAHQLEVWSGTKDDAPVRHLAKVTDATIAGPGAVVIELDSSGNDAEIVAFEPGAYKTSTLIDDYSVFASSVSIYCAPTSETLSTWRNSVLAGVVADYWRQKEAFAQQQVMSQPDADPLEDLSVAQSAELREIEDAEIKKAAISIMRGQDPSGFPITSNAQWYRNHQDHANEILFVEQAFEWEHLQFTLYPFYWCTLEDQAGVLFGLRGGDRQFREFLKAGAARVQIPVRLGFEEDVEAYLNDGMVWSGGDRPRMGSPQYVDMLTERMESMGAPGDEKPALDPDGMPVYWDYSSPTDLVILRTWEGNDSQAPFSRYVPPADVGADDDPLENWIFGSGAVPDIPSDE